MGYAVSIIPIFLYLAVLIALDSFSLVKWRRLIIAVICGIASCMAAFLFFKHLPVPLMADAWLVPMLEEFLKAIVILVFIKMKKVAFVIDATLYGAAVGGGFALLENILYVCFNPEMLISTALFRGLGTAIMHMGLTATSSIILLMLTNRKINSFIAYIPAILPSILLHILFNRFLIEPLIMLALDLAIFTTVFYFLFSQNQKSIYRWLETTVESDSHLLAAMKRGEFSLTPSGQYLLSLKEQFKPDVFFDMYCYVKVYLELSLIAKRNLMLSEAGIDPPKDESYNDNISEFNALRRRIGKTGLLALLPIVKVKDTDKWMINSFLK